QIIYNSHLSDKMDKNKVYLYIDVGGGSTEISLFANAKLVDSCSFNLGTIRILDNQDKPETWDEMRRWVREITRGYKNIYGIGTGGNIIILSRLANENADKLISYAKIRALYDYLISFLTNVLTPELGLKSER